MEANEFSEVLRVFDVSLQHLPLRFYHVNLKTKRNQTLDVFAFYQSALRPNFGFLYLNVKLKIPYKKRHVLSDSPHGSYALSSLLRY